MVLHPPKRPGDIPAPVIRIGLGLDYECVRLGRSYGMTDSTSYQLLQIWGQFLSGSDQYEEPPATHQLLLQIP